MTSETHSPHPESSPPHQTEVGNYFVANYPPFSFWKPEGAPLLLEALEQPPRPDTPLGLYLHIPFCRKRCHFCYFRVYTDKDSSAVNGYLQAALKELDLFANKPLIRGRKLNFVYFGGGTPSYLSVNQLQELTDGLKARLPWNEAEEVTFECEPGTLTEKKLKAIRDLGVTRLSLGVENFDDHILEINGRAHRSREIGRAYEYSREIGFPQINIDLIAGMLEETEDNWKRCIEKTLALQPDSVTIYQMEIPYNTTIYKQMKAEGKLAAPVADWETKRRWVSEAFDALMADGYSISSAYTVVKNPERSPFIYRDRLWEGADLLALGVASFGHLAGIHYQNQQHFDPYIQEVLAGRPPVFRELHPRAEECLIREFILQLKRGSVSFDYFDRKFDADTRRRFREPMREIESAQMGQVHEDRFDLNRQGLLQVDQLLHSFFLPEHRNARYV